MSDNEEVHLTQQPLALPPPPEGGEHTMEVGGTVYRFDALGPMVVNSDGTLSRITNWQKMTQAEKERTLRVLGKRNQLRLSSQESAGGEKLTAAQSQS